MTERAAKRMGSGMKDKSVHGFFVREQKTTGKDNLIEASKMHVDKVESIPLRCNTRTSVTQGTVLTMSTQR